MEHSAIQMIPLSHPSLKAQKSTWKRRGEDRKIWSWWMTPGKQHFPDTTGLTQIGSERLYQRSRDRHRFKSDKIPMLRSRRRHKISPIAKMLFAVDVHWESEHWTPQRSDTEYIRHTLGQVSSSGGACVCCFVCSVWVLAWFVFKRERT